MKSGQAFQEVIFNRELRAALRMPLGEHLDFLETVNLMLNEGAEILGDERVSRDEEIDWLLEILALLDRHKTVFLAAEVDGKSLYVPILATKRAREACECKQHCCQTEGSEIWASKRL